MATSQYYWAESLKNIFPLGIPITYVWTSVTSIINILNSICVEKGATSLLVPTSGIISLSGARKSHEKNCIELITSMGENSEVVHIVQPGTLTFTNYGPEYKFSHFRLELQTLKPKVHHDIQRDSSYTEYNAAISETVLEINPGKYVNFNTKEHGYYIDEDGKALVLQGHRLVVRCLNGIFEIFQNDSLYLLTNDAEDGIHNTMPAKEFNEHLQSFMLQRLEARPS